MRSNGQKPDLADKIAAELKARESGLPAAPAWSLLTNHEILSP